MSDKVILRSVYSKSGQIYSIQPCKDKNGNWPSCVRQVDSFGNMILFDGDKDANKPLIKVTETFKIQDGTTFDLSDPWDAARWEAIKNAPIIAQFREERDAQGNLIIDGNAKRYGRGILYVERPEYEENKKVSSRQKKFDAQNYIFNDPRGADGRLKIARLLGKHMKSVSDANVKNFLLDIADKDPDRIIKLYTGDDLELRMLFMDARDKGVIRSVSGVYVYSDGIPLGGTIDTVVIWMRNPKNKKTLDLIKQDVYGEDLEITNPDALAALNNKKKDKITEEK